MSKEINFLIDVFYAARQWRTLWAAAQTYYSLSGPEATEASLILKRTHGRPVVLWNAASGVTQLEGWRLHESTQRPFGCLYNYRTSLSCWRHISDRMIWGHINLLSKSHWQNSTWTFEWFILFIFCNLVNILLVS